MSKSDSKLNREWFVIALLFSGLLGGGIVEYSHGQLEWWRLLGIFISTLLIVWLGYPSGDYVAPHHRMTEFESKDK